MRLKTQNLEKAHLGSLLNMNIKFQCEKQTQKMIKNSQKPNIFWTVRG